MKRQFHQFWLRITALVVGSFAPVFFFGTMPATSEPARLTLDLLKWPWDGRETFNEATHFLMALAGGFLLGWAVLIWRLSGEVYAAAPEAVRQGVLYSLLGWFCLDSLGSVLSGTPQNILPNIAVLLLAVGPLWRPALEDRPVVVDAV